MARRLVLVARFAVVIVVSLTLQVTLITKLDVANVRADLMLVVAIAAGVSGGPDRGAIVGFFAGLAYDIVLSTPFALSAFAYSLTAYAVGMAEGVIMRAAWWISITVTAGATALGVALYVGLGELLGQPNFYTERFWVILGIITGLNALLSPPVVRVVRWAWYGREPDIGRAERMPSLVR